jgi:hypothetical protein
MNVKETVASKKKLMELCKREGLLIPEGYGARDHFIYLMDSNAPFEAKLEGLTYYEQYVVAANKGGR